MTDEASSEQDATSDLDFVADQYAARIKQLLTHINDLDQEMQKLRVKLLRYERPQSNVVAYLLILIGACGLVSSTIWNSQILGFIGLGLTFWGALLLYARPTRYIHSELVDSTAISAIRALDQVIRKLGYEGTPIYLPPTTVKDVKESRVFLPARMLEDAEGVVLAPPGLGLANLFEEKLGVRFVEVDLDYVKTNLPRLLIEGLELVKNLELEEEGGVVQIKMEESAYASLCSQIRDETDVAMRFGCPLCSAVAVILARVTHRPIVIEQEEVSEDTKTTAARYRMLPG